MTAKILETKPKQTEKEGMKIWGKETYNAIKNLPNYEGVNSGPNRYREKYQTIEESCNNSIQNYLRIVSFRLQNVMKDENPNYFFKLAVRLHENLEMWEKEFYASFN